MPTDRPSLQQQNDPAKRRCEQTLWIWQDGMMIKRRISFVPCLYSMYEQILVNAADNKSAKWIKVTIDVNNAIISVWNDGEGRVPSNELLKQVTSTVKFYQHDVSEKWTKISFKPDLAKFGMGHLEDDTVALMKRRVVDLAGCLGNSVKVELDGTCVQLKTFEEYVQLYLQTSTNTTRIYEKVNDRWEVCICIADGGFEQVSFINYFATLKGGSHVDYITSQVTGYMARVLNLKPNEIKSQLWVFVNALIDNPAFDSQTKESLTTNKDSFGSTCKLSPEFLKKTKDYLLKKKAGNLEIHKLTTMAIDRPPLQPQNDPVTRCEQTLWIWQDGMMIKRRISFVPCLYSMYEQILVNAADNKSAKGIKVTIDVNNAMISVWNDGEERVPSTELWNKANRFCTNFTIETADGYVRKKQVFTNKESYEHRSSEKWTKVSFKPDLAKFGMGHLEDDTVALMKRRVVDLAGCLGNSVKVELDGTCVQLKTFEEYVQLYLQTSTNTTRIYEKVNDRWEVCICIADGEFEQVSFINYFATLKGGSHVDYITSQVTGYMARVLNLKPNEIKSQLWVFVNALIDNPAFDSQTKESLTTNKDSFGSTCKLSPEFLKKIEKSDLAGRVCSYLYSKHIEKLEKRKGRLNIPGLEDAYLAGTAKSGDCTLILTRGDSAKAFAMSGLSYLGHDKYGVFTLKSKLLSLRQGFDKKLEQNAEIINITKILGLQDYKNSGSVRNMRYGHVLIMADEDPDGSHFKGLLISIFYRLWPFLLKQVKNFMCMFKTPIVKASEKTTNDMLLFYTMPEYNKWKEQLGNEATKYEIKYYTWLGTIEREVAKYCFANLDQHIKHFFWVDIEDADAITLAFSKIHIKKRAWLRAPQDYFDPKEKRMRYLDFYNKEFKQYAVADLQRSIPSMVDGLIPGQRKILFCAFKKPIIQNIEVGQFSVYVYEHSAFHHHYGEATVLSTIIGMAQNFVGSNNINLLKPNGQFGSRLMGGKDHASGYFLYTQLSPITRYLFHKDDELILNYLNDNGQSIEPAWFIPVIPVVLVNGSKGRGTECSSFIPNYNPRDIIANLKRLLKGEAMVTMLPWYKGFKGDIQKASKGTGYTTKGKISDDTTNALRITELPVKKWTEDYKEFLAARLGKDIEDYTDLSDDTTVDFEITMKDQWERAKEKETSLNILKLTTTLSTNNMHLLDADGKLKKYDNPEQILKDFYHLRLDFYEKRKTALLRELKKAGLLLENKVRYIREGKIKFDKEMDEIYADLKAKGFKSSTSIERAADRLGWGEEEEEKKKKADRLGWGEEEEEEEEEDEEGYDYLLTFGSAGVTKGGLMKFEVERDEKKKEYDELIHRSSKELWLSDLEALDEQLAGEYSLSINFQSPQDGYESSPKIAEEAPKKKAQTKRTRAAAGPQRANKRICVR